MPTLLNQGTISMLASKMKAESQLESGDIAISQCSIFIYKDSDPGVEIPVSTATASKGLCGKESLSSPPLY